MKIISFKTVTYTVACRSWMIGSNKSVYIPFAIWLKFEVSKRSTFWKFCSFLLCVMIVRFCHSNIQHSRWWLFEFLILATLLPFRMNSELKRYKGNFICMTLVCFGCAHVNGVRVCVGVQVCLWAMHFSYVWNLLPVWNVWCIACILFHHLNDTEKPEWCYSTLQVRPNIHKAPSYAQKRVPVITTIKANVKSLHFFS